MNTDPNGLTFTVSMEEFKQLTGEFVKAAADPDLTDDQLENGWKALALAYFGCDQSGPNLIMAKSYFEYAAKHYMKRKFG